MFITGYGIGPTSTMSGDPQVLNGSSSRSASLGVSGVEDDERGELRAGAVRCVHEPGEHGQVVRGVRDRFPVEAQQVGRGLDRMGDQPTDDRLRADAAGT